MKKKTMPPWLRDQIKRKERERAEAAWLEDQRRNPPDVQVIRTGDGEVLKFGLPQSRGRRRRPL